MKRKIEEESETEAGTRDLRCKTQDPKPETDDRMPETYLGRY